MSDDEITVTFDSEATHRFGTDHETGEVFARFYRCAYKHWAYECGVSVLEAMHLRTLRSHFIEDRCEEMARDLATRAFYAAEEKWEMERLRGYQEIIARSLAVPESLFRPGIPVGAASAVTAHAKFMRCCREMLEAPPNPHP